MQRVTELVEKRGDFVKREQGGLAGGRLGDVEVVADDRMGAAQVKSAGTRLLKWLGVAAAVFLAVVGVLLVAGWRAKARRGG